MNKLILISIFALLIFIIFYRENKRRSFDGLFLFNMVFIFYFCFIPIHLLGSKSDFAPSHFQDVSVGGMKSTLVIIIFYLSFLVSYKYSYKILYKHLPVFSKLKNFECNIKSTENMTAVFIIFTLLVTYASIVIYVTQFESLIVPFRDAAKIRSVSELRSQAGPFVFFKNFISISSVSVLLCYTYYKKYNVDKKIILLAIASVIAYALSLVIISSRGFLANLLLIIFLIELYHNRPITPNDLVKFMLIFITIVFAILFLNNLFVSLYLGMDRLGRAFSDGGIYSYYTSFIKNFSHYYINIEIALMTDLGTGSIRVILDWIYGFLNLIPEKITGYSPPKTIGDLHSDTVLGDISATLPVGIIAYSWYSFNILGIILYPLLMGFTAKIIDEHIFTHREDPIELLFYLYSVLFIVYYFVSSGDPRLFIIGNIDLAAFFSGILFINLANRNTNYFS